MFALKQKKIRNKLYIYFALQETFFIIASHKQQETMKTLLERLKPEARKYLENNKKKTPWLCSLVKDTLNNNFHEFDIPILLAEKIWHHCTKGTKPMDVNGYYALFNKES